MLERLGGGRPARDAAERELGVLAPHRHAEGFVQVAFVVAGENGELSAVAKCFGKDGADMPNIRVNIA